jgi:uncharacterized protein YdcH (DUF465 family)
MINISFLGGFDHTSALTNGLSLSKINTMEKHDLLHEFPQYSELIHNLKISDNHFRKLFDEYHETDHHIHRIEQGNEPTTDQHLTDLRKQRLYLKDELYRMLTAAS